MGTDMATRITLERRFSRLVLSVGVALTVALLVGSLMAGSAGAEKSGRKDAVDRANAFIAACFEQGGNPEVVEDGSSATPENNQVIVTCTDWDSGTVTGCNFNTNECVTGWIPERRVSHSIPRRLDSHVLVTIETAPVDSDSVVVDGGAIDESQIDGVEQIVEPTELEPLPTDGGTVAVTSVNINSQSLEPVFSSIEPLP
jgi:hypothetical protein